MGDPECPACESNHTEWIVGTPAQYRCKSCGHEWEKDGAEAGDDQ